MELIKTMAIIYFKFVVALRVTTISILNTILTLSIILRLIVKLYRVTMNDVEKKTHFY